MQYRGIIVDFQLTVVPWVYTNPLPEPLSLKAQYLWIPKFKRPWPQKKPLVSTGNSHGRQPQHDTGFRQRGRSSFSCTKEVTSYRASHTSAFQLDRMHWKMQMRWLNPGSWPSKPSRFREEPTKLIVSPNITSIRASIYPPIMVLDCWLQETFTCRSEQFPLRSGLNPGCFIATLRIDNLVA